MNLLELFSPKPSAKLLAWFGDSKVVDDQGNPLVLYHGTGASFSHFDRMTWGSVSPKLAGEYAAMRGHMGGNPNIIPIYMHISNPIDADAMPDAVTVKSFFASLLKQSGHPFTDEIGQLVGEVLAAAREEESGPHYNRHDFWHQASDLFGRKGAANVMKIIQMLGFDGVKMTELEELTYGAFSPSQVISALVADRGITESVTPSYFYHMTDNRNGEVEEGITEGADTQEYPEFVDAYFIQEYVKELHYNKDDFSEGDLIDRIYNYDEYVLVPDLPISRIRLQYATDDEEVETYSQMDTPFPPIVYDMKRRSIIDGTHRVKAAIQRGDKTIRAYVGVMKNKPKRN